jgi:hypothetical protein
MAERITKKSHTRFKTVVSVLIAAVTVAGAVTTWRISVAGGKAEAFDAQGLSAALNSANAAISVSTYLSNNLSFYISYRRHLAAADLLEKQARVSGGAKRSSLLEAARRERNMAATSRGYVDADYLEFDPSDGRESFNGNRYWEAQLASERALKPLDEKPSFESADAMRLKARKLVDVTIALSAALFLFVAATAVRRRVKYLFAAAAILVFLLSSTAAVMIEIAGKR